MSSQNDADSTRLSYWLNWRVFLCEIWVLAPVVGALFIIWKYEDRSVETRANDDDDDDDDGKGRQDLSVDDVWRPCLNQIHPGWLLGFRVLAFCFLLATTIVRLLVRGWSIFYYYTQWTFTLLTIYFGLGSLLSVYGCSQCGRQQSMRVTTDRSGTVPENGHRQPFIEGEGMNSTKNRKIAGARVVSKALDSCIHLFQIIFQMSAGAIVLTDCIYWGVIFPYLSIQDYDLNFRSTDGQPFYYLDFYLNQCIPDDGEFALEQPRFTAL
ncbi:PREDICTED: uncharacterized protein LOC104805383 isoform X2 [Tarenaya hassleriana]|uniref:uncharacterized protein LOC104805383 isoform X2 n=1 Tax=Tarenaya hassleriana TaxID=28532 RepID=UPI0008FD0328|nr:PREDICTED: uncharacterized protein LOC104805383 isoform X2 [Tarenaya hassleriana]